MSAERGTSHRTNKGPEKSHIFRGEPPRESHTELLMLGRCWCPNSLGLGLITSPGTLWSRGGSPSWAWLQIPACHHTWGHTWEGLGTQVAMSSQWWEITLGEGTCSTLWQLRHFAWNCKNKDVGPKRSSKEILKSLQTTLSTRCPPLPITMPVSSCFIVFTFDEAQESNSSCLYHLF